MATPSEKLADALEAFHDLETNGSVAIRTNKQNNAMQKYCELLAEAFNDAGMDMRAVLREDVDIPWGKDTVREHIWRPIMQAKTQKKSTTLLTREEVTQIYEIINRHTASKFGISVEFPCEK